MSTLPAYLQPDANNFMPEATAVLALDELFQRTQELPAGSMVLPKGMSEMLSWWEAQSATAKDYWRRWLARDIQQDQIAFRLRQTIVTRFRR